jgi:putative ABC transport system permease protein
MNLVTQIRTVVGLNLRSLPQRLGTSFVIIIGSAGVVAVLVAVLAMSVGMSKTLQGTGRDDRAIVLRKGSVSESGSACRVVPRKSSSTRQGLSTMRVSRW